jgi:hypothetical protein
MLLRIINIHLNGKDAITVIYVWFILNRKTLENTITVTYDCYILNRETLKYILCRLTNYFKQLKVTSRPSVDKNLP